MRFTLTAILLFLLFYTPLHMCIFYSITNNYYLLHFIIHLGSLFYTTSTVPASFLFFIVVVLLSVASIFDAFG